MAQEIFSVSANFSSSVNFIKQGAFQFLTGNNSILVNSGATLTYLNQHFQINAGTNASKHFEVAAGGKHIFGDCENIAAVLAGTEVPRIRNSCVIHESGGDKNDIFSSVSGTSSEEFRFYGGRISGATNVDIRTYDAKLFLIGVDLSNTELWTCNDATIIGCYIHDTDYAFSGVKGTIRDVTMKRVNNFADAGNTSGTYLYVGIDAEILVALMALVSATTTLGLFEFRNCVLSRDTISGTPNAAATFSQTRGHTWAPTKASDGSPLSCRIKVTGDIASDVTATTHSSNLRFKKALGTSTWTTTASYSVIVRAYGYDYDSYSLTVAQGLSAVAYAKSFKTQPVVQTSKATVDAYTTLENLDKLFDRILADQVTDFSLPGVIASGVGDAVNLGAYNLALNAGAGSVLVIAGSNITAKAATLGTGTVYKRVLGSGSITAPACSDAMTFDGPAFLSLASIPVVATVKNSAQGLRITAPGTYDLSLWTFSGNTADVTIANSTGAVTIKTGGQTLSITQGTGNTVTFDETVPYVLNFPITGGTMAAQNLGKFFDFKGVYVSHVAAQAAITSPVLADYYAVDADSNGIREAHGYWSGSSWVVHASAIITEHEILATSNGGAGVGAAVTLNLLQGQTWRIYADKVGYYPSMVEITVPTGGGSKDLTLSENPSTIDLLSGDYSAAAALVVQASLLPADSASIMTLLMPSMAGQTPSVHFAFVELMRCSLDNARGALAAANAFCVEVDNYIVRLRDDTLRVKPLPAHPAGTRSVFEVPLVLENYTIDLNPVDANGNYMAVSVYPRQVVVGATVLGGVNIATVDMSSIKKTIAAFGAD